MTDPILTKTKTRDLYWWAVILFFAFLSVNSLASSILAALVGAKWDLLSGQEKFLIVVAVVANWTGLVIAFLQRSLARIAQGKPPIETGDTQQWEKK